jgi:hypothetical protein
MLAGFDIAACFAAFCSQEHCIKLFLSDKTLDGAGSVISGALRLTFTHLAVFAFCHILDAVPVGMISPSFQFFPGRTAVCIG